MESVLKTITGYYEPRSARSSYMESGIFFTFVIKNIVNQITGEILCFSIILAQVFILLTKIFSSKYREQSENFMLMRVILDTTSVLTLLFNNSSSVESHPIISNNTSGGISTFRNDIVTSWLLFIFSLTCNNSFTFLSQQLLHGKKGF